MSNDIKLKKKLILGDLGKATRRGIRRCPQCGTLNGTRGLSCKNSLCDMVFKEIIDKPRRINLDACKIITEQSPSCLSWATTFSVRLKERCPDHLRGFVQIEYEDLNNHDETSHRIANPILLQLESVDLSPAKGTCHVAGCPKRGHCSTISEADACMHVQACISQREINDSQPFTVKHSILNSMSIASDWKQTIWLKARRDGPLVQRVTRSCMVVKCDKDEQFPLGFLHTCFLSGTPDIGSHRFGCACTVVSSSLSSSSSLQQQLKKKNVSIVALNSPEMYASNSPEVKARCVHFYSCMAAFSSDHVLAKEFARFISDEQVVSSMQQVIAILGEDGSNIKVEVMEEENLDQLFQSNDEVVIASKNSCNDLDLHIEMEAITPDDILGLVKRDIKENSSSELQHRASFDSNDRMNQHQYPVQTALDWLASITERINLTMHYGFTGQPDPLVFPNVPQHFFNFLMERISAGSRKKRLPNSTQAFVQKQVLPMGTFTRYTWLLTNVLHVKQVFDTPLVSLEVSRKFTQSNDGSTFKLVAEENNENCGALNKKTMKLIRPLEFKTFLKVGQMSSDPRNVTPFTIEYVPDILPRTKIGEMRIKFEYGHQRNGQVVSNAALMNEKAA